MNIMASQSEGISDLNDVVLKDSPPTDSKLLHKSSKMPKRLLQFSDGVLEENSSDDEAPAPKMVNTAPTADPVTFRLCFGRCRTLDWLPWTWYHTSWVGSKMLEGCDCVGEYLAHFFGITTPKYQFEIDEYYRLKAEEEEIMRKTDLEMGGWSGKNKNNLIHHDDVSPSTST